MIPEINLFYEMKMLQKRFDLMNLQKLTKSGKKVKFFLFRRDKIIFRFIRSVVKQFSSLYQWLSKKKIIKNENDQDKLNNFDLAEKSVSKFELSVIKLIRNRR